MPLPLLAETLGIGQEPLLVVLAMFQGLRGVRLIDRPGAVAVVRLPEFAVARLGLSRVRGRWSVKVEEDEGVAPRGRPVRVDILRIPPADPRVRTPLETLIVAEESRADRIANVGRWLAEWGKVMPPDGPKRTTRPRREGSPATELPERTEQTSTRPRSFDLRALRQRLDESP